MTAVSAAYWRHLLARSDSLSARFVARHARLLTQLADGADPTAIRRAVEIAPHNPREAERLLLGVAGIAARDASRGVVGLSGPARFVEQLSRWITSGGELDNRLSRLPALERTWVPLHPGRRATWVPESPAGPLVVLAWPADSVSVREQHRAAIQHIAEAANARPDSSDIRIAVPDTYAVAHMSHGDPWVFAPDFGMTVEDALRAGTLTTDDRRRLVRALATLRTAMLDHELVWQGFAPRNMFLRGDELTLIDFEACADTGHDPVVAAQHLVWHQVFFADCLTDIERNVLFVDHANAPTPPDDATLPTDEFERALLGGDTVTWDQRRHLLLDSARLEGRHLRPSPDRDGGLLFGHELGHFWGDFLSAEVEARIFVMLNEIEYEPTLVACLEVFEAAMEADIDAYLLAAAIDDPAPSPERTVALAQLLETAGAAALMAERTEHPHWYDAVVEHPAKLVDGTCFTLRETLSGMHHQDIARYLVGDPDHCGDHTRHLTRTIESGMSFLHADDREQRFLNYAEPKSLRKLLAEPLPLDGIDFDDVLADADERIIRHSISQSSASYLAFPDAGNAVAGLAGSMLTRLLNQNLIAVDRSGPAATFATIQVIEWLRALVGYEAKPITELRGVRDVAGLWTTGGHLSNHIAMLAALGSRFPEARTRGLRALETQPAVVMAGSIAHYSHSDAAFHLGLGWDAVLHVPAQRDYTTDPTAVDALLSDPPQGVTPFMVIGVAGNCRTTGMDDLTAIAEVCQRHGVWFHVDACHGGALIFNQRLREQRLAGIDQADSVALDPHKGLFTPYPSSYVVFRDRGVLNQFSRHPTMVEADGCWDLGLITPFLGSCGFEALPTWMLIKNLGVHGLGALVEVRERLIRHLERRLDDTGLFVRLNDVDFYRLAFVFCPPAVRATIRATGPTQRERLIAAISRFTSQLNEQLYQNGQVCFDEHTLADLDDRVGLGAGAKYTIMACCPGNPLTTIGDLDRAVDSLLNAARPLAGAMHDALAATVHDAPMRLSGPAGWNDQ